MRSYAENINKFKLQILADREKHTINRNGVQLRSEEVMREFLNR